MFKTLGTPNETIWPGVSQLKYFRELSFAPLPSRLREMFPPVSITGTTLSATGLDLLQARGHPAF